MTARNPRAAAGGTLLLTLAAGFLLGLVWSRRSPTPPEPVVAAEQAGAADESAAAADGSRGRETRRRGLIVERVGLSAEQQVQVDSVVGHARGMMRQLRADYRSGYGELIESTRSSIKAVLTPGQAAEYDELLADFDRRREMGDERPGRDADARGRDRGQRERDSGEEQEPDRRESDRRESDRREWTYGF